MSLPDPRAWPRDIREQVAWRAHEQDELDEFPELEYYNPHPCPKHAPSSDPLCGECGLALRHHQRTAAAWQFFAGHTLLADTVGSGKTATACATLAMAKATGELGPRNRAVVVCQPAAVRDPWAKDLHRLLPGIPHIIADGSPEQRRAAYVTPWEICVISDRTFSHSRGRDGDIELLEEFPVGIAVFDDLDPLRHRDTATAYAARRLADSCARVHELHGTPLQKKLAELFCVTEPIGSRVIFPGGLTWFRRRYVTQSETKVWVVAALCPGGAPCGRHETLHPGCAQCGKVHRWPPYPGKRAGRCPICRQNGRVDPTGRARVEKVIYTDNGVVQERLPEFQRLIAPIVLRRTSFTDVDLPDIQVNPVHLELLPAQRARYAELKKGVLKRLRHGVEEVSQTEAAAAFTRGAQICSGLAALDDGNDVSVKLDWTVDKLTGDLSDEKVVCYVHFRDNVRALSARLDAAGVGHVLFWSEETDSRTREARRIRFLEDPDCRVLIGTTTIEKSLNLQVASAMIAVDTILNQSRMTQLIGRIRRQGSRHQMVTLHHLLALATQEDAYLDLLGREGDMADAVWEEAQAIFSYLTPRQAMEMIAGRAI